MKKKELISKQKKLSPPPDDGRDWIRRDRDLVRGDILRVLIDELHPDWGYLYAWCSGGGFGCRIGALGNAIYVIESTSLNAIEKLKDGLKNKTMKEPVYQDSTYNPCRWESRWNIYILKEE